MAKRITIGFMTRSVRTPVGSAIWKGVVKAARDNDVNLITIDGDNVGRDSTLIYELMKKNNVDGVLTWASNKIDKYTPFYEERIGNIPIVTLTQQIGDYPVVKIDSYAGMKIAIRHLVEVHNIRKIVFMKGEANNSYFTERYQGYVDALKELGIPFDPKLVTEDTQSNVASGAVSEIVRAKLEGFLSERNLEPGKDFQAIVTVSEVTSIGIFDYLKGKGIAIPDQVAVLSYDNSMWGRFMRPKPTAMMLPFADQSTMGFELLLSKIKGKEVSQEYKLPSSLEINMSCGCKEKSMDMATSATTYEIENQGKKKRVSKDSLEPLTFEELKKSIGDKFIEHLMEQSKTSLDFLTTLRNGCDAFLSAFISDVERKDSHKAVGSLEQYIQTFNQHNLSFQLLQNLISIVREEMIPHIHSVEEIDKLEEMFHQLRTQISSQMTYYEGTKNAVQISVRENLNEFVRMLSGQYKYPQIYDAIEKRLHLINIPDIFIVRYPNPTRYNFRDSLPEKSEFAFGICNSKRVYTNETLFNTQELFPSDIKNRVDISNLLILPLISAGEHIGYVAFQNGPADRLLYAALRDQLSNSLKGAYIMEKVERAEMESAKSLDTLKQKAEVITQNTQSINSLIQAMSTAMKNISKNVKLISSDVMNVVQESNTVVQVTDEANVFVDDLNTKAQEINSIINLITDITEKTNVLSINARIEAARAGVGGRGFAVVANEIKILSEQTNSSTLKINEMIGEMQNGSSKTLSSMSNVHSIIKNIYSLTENINNKIDEHIQATQLISNQLSEASLGSQEIYTAILEVAADN